MRERRGGHGAGVASTSGAEYRSYTDLPVADTATRQPGDFLGRDAVVCSGRVNVCGVGGVSMHSMPLVPSSLPSNPLMFQGGDGGRLEFRAQENTGVGNRDGGVGSGGGGLPGWTTTTTTTTTTTMTGWGPRGYVYAGVNTAQGSQNRPPNWTVNVNAGGHSNGTTGIQGRYHPYGKAGEVHSQKTPWTATDRTNKTTAKAEPPAIKSSGAPTANVMLLLPPTASITSNDFGDPLVALASPEPWVNEIMREQFRADESVVFDTAKTSYSRKGAWTFPFSRYQSVLQSLKTSNASNISPLPPTVASTLALAPRIKDDSMRYANIPPMMEAKLMPFQREGIKFILRRGGRALLGDEMGLGKTVQALATMSAYRDEWPVMIMCPSSLRESWSVAIQEWLGVSEGKIRVVHTGKDAEATAFGTFDFLIISYGFLDKIKDAEMFNIVVVDESHCLKDWTAKRTKAAMPILKKAKRVVLLTGTPALNRPKEIFTQLSAVVPKANLKLKDFGERYCQGNRFDKYGGAKNLDELFALLHSSVMVRRLKNDVLSELPRKRRQKVFLSLDAAGRKEMRLLKAQMDENRAALVSSLLSGKTGALRGNGVIMEVYKKTAEIKIKAVQEYVGQLIETGEKFLIFAHHKALLDAIEHACNRGGGGKSKAAKKPSYIRIDGDTPAQHRGSMVESFQNDPAIQVAILSIKAAGVGLTLTAASTVVFAELTWVPGDLIQAEDRAHRIGQQKSVNVSFLLVKDSIDEIIWNTIEQKLENLGECLNGQEQKMNVTHTVQRDANQPSILSFFSTQSQSQKDGKDVDDVEDVEETEDGANRVDEVVELLE